MCSTAFVNVAVSSSQPPSSWSELSMPSCGSASCTKSQGSLAFVCTSLRPVGNLVTSPAAAASSAARRWPRGGTSAVAASVSSAASSCAAIFAALLSALPLNCEGQAARTEEFRGFSACAQRKESSSACAGVQIHTGA